MIDYVFDSRELWFPVGVEESLALHGYRWGAGTFQRGGPVRRLDFPPDMRQPKLPAVGYREWLGTVWLREHTWYLYNPGPRVAVGVGKHEGDWEMVQIGLDSKTLAPQQVALSQHSWGVRREWRKADVRGDRLQVYVALGSHALYFEAGRHAHDMCDGRGRRLALQPRPPGPWWRWSGRWGNSGDPPGSGSPKSPGRQRGRPEDFQRQARG